MKRGPLLAWICMLLAIIGGYGVSVAAYVTLAWEQLPAPPLPRCIVLVESPETTTAGSGTLPLFITARGPLPAHGIEVRCMIVATSDSRLPLHEGIVRLQSVGVSQQMALNVPFDAELAAHLPRTYWLVLQSPDEQVVFESPGPRQILVKPEEPIQITSVLPEQLPVGASEFSLLASTTNRLRGAGVQVSISVSKGRQFLSSPPKELMLTPETPSVSKLFAINYLDLTPGTSAEVELNLSSLNPNVRILPEKHKIRVTASPQSTPFMPEPKTGSPIQEGDLLVLYIDVIVLDVTQDPKFAEDLAHFSESHKGRLSRGGDCGRASWW